MKLASIGIANNTDRKWKAWWEITPAQQIERVENLLRVLRSMPKHARENHFDMGSWGYQNECGTVACAAGHAGMDPWFKRRGFIMDLAGFYRDSASGRWPKARPIEFFGMDLQTKCFTCSWVTSHAEAVEAVKLYLKQLKSEERHGKAA